MSGLSQEGSAATALERLRYQTLQNFNTIDVSPRTDDFQRGDVFDGFDMPDVVTRLHGAFDLTDDQGLYLVVFRSQRNEGLTTEDVELLTEQDHNAHQEASGKKDEYGRTSLLHYFKGLPDADGFCMSWCIWTSEATAKLASGTGPKSEESQAVEHHKAMLLARRMYQKYGIQTYRMRLAGEGMEVELTQDTWTAQMVAASQQRELELSQAGDGSSNVSAQRAVGFVALAR